MKAVIMAGGKGTRLQSINKDIPKPMFKINGKSILEYQVECLKRNNITDIIISIGYLGEVIKNYFVDGSKFGVNIQYIEEKIPLGSAGSLYYMKDILQDDFLLIFGDLIFDIDFDKLINFHKNKNALITLCGHPNTHPYDSDIVIADSNCKVLSIYPKNLERNFYYHNFVNAGIYCVNNSILSYFDDENKIDFEKDIMIKYIDSGDVYAYKTTEYIKDMGTVDRYKSVEADIINGIVNKKNLKNKQKAIFLDRDGTINVLKDYVRTCDELMLLDNISEAVKLINISGYLVIVITNQPVLARGECTFEELDMIHKKLETDIGKNGAYIDDIYYCPHHPDKGFIGEISELKIKCDCRKPQIGLLLKASEKYNIDLKQSWFIGDSTVDIQTGKNAHMNTALVLTGEKGKDKKYDVESDLVGNNLLDVIKKIM